MTNTGTYVANVTSKGQVTLPKEIRARLGLRRGDRVRFRERSDGTVVIEAAGTDLMQLFGALVPRGGRHVSVDRMKVIVRGSAARTGRG